MRARRYFIALALGVALFLGVVLYARRTQRPASLGEGWHACLVEPASIVETGGERPVIGAGSTSVLRVSAKWGQSHFETEHSHGELLLELSRGLKTGSVVPFSNGVPHGSYREGGMGPVYITRTLEGTIQVLATTPQVMTIMIDLKAASPLLNEVASDIAPLTGTVRAVRTQIEGECVKLWRAD
jgi:hypothetical protein